MAVGDVGLQGKREGLGRRFGFGYVTKCLPQGYLGCHAFGSMGTRMLQAIQNVHRGGAQLTDPDTLLDRPIDPSIAEPTAEPQSYRLLGDVPGDTGGRLKLIQRTRGLESWFNRSDDGKEGFTLDGFRGDPLWNVAALGPELCHMLGFMEIGPALRTIPDAAEANGALDRLEALGGSLVATPIRFYEPTGHPRVDDVAYAEVFTRLGLLPIARDTVEANHDVNFHFQAVFLPHYVVEEKRAEGRALFAFRDWVAAHAPEARALDGRLLSEHVTEAIVSFAEVVDHVTGSPQVGLNPQIPAYISLVNEQPCTFDYWLGRYLDDGCTPETYFRAWFGPELGLPTETRCGVEAFIELHAAQDPRFRMRVAVPRRGHRERTLERLEAARRVAARSVG